MALSSKPADNYAAAFDSFRSSAFRFESLQKYDVEEERDELRLFLSGEHLDTCSPSMEEWCAEISTAKLQGKLYQRIRKIQFPLTDYTRFEIMTGFRVSSEAGEQIHLLEKEPADLNLASLSDFWLFDDTMCFWLRYDTSGRFLKVDQADATGLKLCLELKPKLLAASVELRESTSWRTLFPKEASEIV